MNGREDPSSFMDTYQKKKKNLSNQRLQINSMLKQAGLVSVVTDKSPDAQDQ